MAFFAIEATLRQTLRVEVRGGEIMRFPRTAPAAEAGTEHDIVQLWVEAVNAGLLGSASSRARGTASVEKLVSDASLRRHAWAIEVDAVDPGAFRILCNLLVARKFEECSVRTMAPASGELPLDLAAIPFPKAPEHLPFEVTWVDDGGAPELCAELEFHEPDDEIVDAAIQALDTWGELVSFGGYALSDAGRRPSGALPLGAILYDPCTVMQGFEGVFRADFSAFEAVVNYAFALTKRGVRVASVLIR